MPRPPLMTVGFTFALQIGVEFGLVDDEAFMGSLADQAGIIMSVDGKDQTASVHLHQFHVNPHLEAHRRGGHMTDVDMGSHGLLGGAVKVGAKGLNAGPFEQADHETGGQNDRHHLKLGRFRIERGNGFAFTDPKGELMFDPGFQFGFHPSSFPFSYSAR
ncbi:hypothetical protein DESC_720020 [Desulfosarcina cetonica]|nr:hypothetical protein DESC_720020 [Desulfosarcina cetonica]